MLWRRSAYRLTPDEAVRALLASGTVAEDEQILSAVQVMARSRVRRIAEQQRTTGSRRPRGGW